MKVCVVGAGAIGGLLGVKLALDASVDVTLIARGPHLEAIRANGLKLIMNDGTEHVASHVTATSGMRECGSQDLVILALKAHQIAPVIDDICSLIGPETTVLTTQNGLPWWYFQRHGGPHDGKALVSLDPTGEITAKIDPAKIIGCIAYPAAEITEPGVIKHVEGMRFPLGELDGQTSERAEAISAMFIEAGFKSPILDNIRAEIWLKAWGNLSFNPISALTHATLVDICQFPESRKLAEQMMTEAQDVAHKLDITFRVSLEKRINGAERVGKHKTSMLQDVEAGKALEVDALVGSVVELGEMTDTPTPAIRAIYAACKLLNNMISQDKISIRAQSHA
jgi:2-dehydropantoate 2-reductase